MKLGVKSAVTTIVVVVSLLYTNPSMLKGLGQDLSVISKDVVKTVSDLTQTLSDLTHMANDIKAVANNAAYVHKTLTDDDTADCSDNAKHTTEKKVVNVYSARKEEFTQEIFDLFQNQTGIAVALIHDEPGKLLSRMESERKDPIADVIITADAISMYIASKKGLISPLPESILERLPDNYLRSSDWVAITKRARVVAYSKDRVSAEDLDSLGTYQGLSSDRWKGRVAIRSSSNPYNQMFIASMIYHHGMPWAENWCKGIVGNMARNPQGGDTDQIKAILSGIADVAVVNHYYYVRMLAKDPDLAKKVGVVYPDQGEGGTHINISSAAIANNASHREYSEKFLEFLLSTEVQNMFAQKNYEYSVVDGTTMPALLVSENKLDHSSLQDIAAFYDDANAISIKNGWY